MKPGSMQISHEFEPQRDLRGFDNKASYQGPGTRQRFDTVGKEVQTQEQNLLKIRVSPK